MYLSKLSRSIVDFVVHISDLEQRNRGGTVYSTVYGPRGGYLQCDEWFGGIAFGGDHYIV